MSFLLTQIREQKLLEIDVEAAAFIEEHGISEQAMIFELVFDKKVFVSEKEVREYLQDKFYFGPDITDNGDTFTAVLTNKDQLDLESAIEVEIRRGVSVKAADFKPLVINEEIRFNDKDEILMATNLDGIISLNEGVPHIIEIARVAKGHHPLHGEVDITQETLESMETNFKAGVTGVDLAINEDHERKEAFAWFIDVFLSYDKQVLYGQVKWNAKGIRALSDKEYRYFSPEFRFNYIHPHDESRTGLGPTLVGGAITNYPFLKMDAIVELNNKPETGEPEMSKDTIALSIYNDKVNEVVDLSTKLNSATAEKQTADAKVVELNSKVEELEKTIELNEKKGTNQKLFDAGKVNAAQLKALNEGKGMLEVLSLNEKVNSEAKGGSDNNDEVINLSAGEKKMASSLGLTDEEYVKYGKE